MIEQLEKVIIDRLKEEFEPAKCEVLAMPDDLENYSMKHPSGALLVQYSGTTTQSTGSMVFQTEVHEFTIHILFRNLRTHEGVYEVIDNVKAVLREATAQGGFVHIGTDFRDYFEDNGVWHYESRFVAPVAEYL